MPSLQILSLPVARRKDGWWPPGVQGFGYLQSGDAAAPFFVHIDRAGAPAAHRTALVASWYRFGEGSPSWGRDSVPPILILCPGPNQERVWEKAVLSSADRREVALLNVVLADRSALLNAPDTPIWRAPAFTNCSSLGQRLTWWPNTTSEHVGTTFGELPACPRRDEQRLHAWAQATANRISGVPTFERIAALSLATASVEKRLLDCLGRHPLLTESDLTVVLGVARRVARLAVARALKRGLIVASGHRDDAQPRYCLTMTALRFLAACDGVLVRRYARHAPITAMPAAADGRMPTLLLQREHTIGANSFFLGWLRAGTASPPRLVSWLNAAESALRFECAGGRRWLRPDGSGQVLLDGQRWPFLLEWDRGTERLPVIATKLARYAEFYRSQSASQSATPTLLFVTTTPQREELVQQIAVATLGNQHNRLLTTTSSLVDRLGPLAAIWRTGETRGRWPKFPSTMTTPSWR